jgi:tripartite-type tricarboxylate transporter receptor subunit TctC
MKRRTLIQWACASAATSVVASPSFAQSNWASKPISLIVPYPAGNTADLAARVIGPFMSQQLGQPVVVDNRPGAGGNLATALVAKAPKDGHTLLITTSAPLVISPFTSKNPGYNAETDFEAIGSVGYIPMVLITRNDLPVQTLPEFIQYIKANAEKVSYGSVGNGTFTHMGMELLASTLGIKLTHIPYRGASAAHVDLVGGRIDFMFDSLASSNVLLKSNRVKAVALTASTRSPFLMTVPTFLESGDKQLQQFDINIWTGLFAPAGTPKSIINSLNSVLRQALLTTSLRAQLSGQFIRATDPMTSVEFTKLVANDRNRWGRLAKQINLEVT